MSNPAVNADFQIATQAGGEAALVTLASLGIPKPRPIYKNGVTSVDLGDNSSRIMGAPQVMWGWGFLSQAQRDTLRTFCTGASAPVYIVTPTIDNEGSVPNVSKTFLAQMIWPSPNTPEGPQAGRRLEFVILFRQLVEQ